MSYLLLLLYTALILLFIYYSKFYQSAILPKNIVASIFILKFIGGVIVYIVYTKYYGGRSTSDIFKYFDDGNIIYSSLWQNPVDYFRMVTGIGGDAPHLIKYYDTCGSWIKNFNYGLFNDNRTVIRFNAVARLFSLGNIHIHTLFMSFISFTGLWGIYKLFEHKLLKANYPANNIYKPTTSNSADYNTKNGFTIQKWLLPIVVFFFPSVYFWTSGILKEGILMFAFGMLLYHFFQLLESPQKTKHIIWIGIAAPLLLISKFYILVAALPGLLFVLIIRYWGKKHFTFKLISVLLLFFVLSWFSKPIIGVSFPDILANKQNDFVTYTDSLNYVGSKIEIPMLKPNLKSILINSPSAFFRTLFRPSVFEISNLMSFMAAFENLIIALLLIVMALLFTTKNIKNEWLWFCVLFVVILFTLSGLTTPVLGALVRYKAPALPFLGIAVMFLVNFERLKI